jgi:hypothetical protein
MGRVCSAAPYDSLTKQLCNAKYCFKPVEQAFRHLHWPKRLQRFDKIID